MPDPAGPTRAEQERALLIATMQAIAVAADLTSALTSTLACVCEATGWPIGQAWMPRLDGAELECGPALVRDARLEAFHRASLGVSFPPGVGLPGAVWRDAAPVWVRDVTRLDSFPRVAEARAVGIVTAMGIPVLVGSEVVAVLEFFVTEPRDEDGPLLAVVSAVAAQLGALVQRRRAEDALREAETSYRHLVTSVRAIVWRADPRTFRFSFVSPEAESLLGYSVAQWTDDPRFWVEHLHPDDRAWAVEFSVLATKECRPHDFEYRMIAKDGRTVWLRDVVRVIARDETPVELVGVMFDVTHRKQSEAEILQSREELRALWDRLQTAREEERTGIARELHDEVGQELTALKMDLVWLRRQLAGTGRGAPRRERLRRIVDAVEMTDAMIGQIQQVSSSLRPHVLDELGLPAAIEWQLREFGRRAGLRTKLRAVPRGLAIPQGIATAMYRALQESLTNVARHAAARAVTVSLRHGDGRLTLQIADDGRGISRDQATSSGSLGLLGMRERARQLGGELTVEGISGRGTRVSFEVPLAVVRRGRAPRR